MRPVIVSTNQRLFNEKALKLDLTCCSLLKYKFRENEKSPHVVLKMYSFVLKESDYSFITSTPVF